MRRFRLAFILGAALSPGAVYGAECPTAANAEKGFTLLHLEGQSEFRNYEGPIVRIVNTYGTPSRQILFTYRGLIELSLMSAEAQHGIHALSDLEGVFPLKKGARHKIPFIRLDPNKSNGAPMTYELSVTGQETVKLENCKYKVWRIRQTTKQGTKQVDAWSALYSPDLEATLAKIYDEGTANEYTVRYERIRPLQR